MAAEMNGSEYNDDGSGSLDSRRDLQRQEDTVIDWSTIMSVRDVIWYSAVVLGVPGNILSAIVWLRHQPIGRSSSVYLAALALVNLVYLLTRFLCLYLHVAPDGWHWLGANYLAGSAGMLAPLLLLSFSVERLMSVIRPLKVRFVCRIITQVEV